MKTRYQSFARLDADELHRVVPQRRKPAGSIKLPPIDLEQPISDVPLLEMVAVGRLDEMGLDFFDGKDGLEPDRLRESAHKFLLECRIWEDSARGSWNN